MNMCVDINVLQKWFWSKSKPHFNKINKNIRQFDEAIC